MRLASPTSKTQLIPRLTFCDIVWSALAPILALALREPQLLDADANYLLLTEVYEYVAISFACALIAAVVFDLGGGLSRFFSARDLWSIFAASAMASSGSALLTFAVTRLDTIPRSTPIICAILLALGFAGGRLVAGLRSGEPTAEDAFTGDSHTRRVILVGVDRFSFQAIRLVDCQVPRTTQFVAALDPRGRLAGRSVNGVKIVGVPANLRSIVEEYAVHGVSISEVWMSDEFVGSQQNASEIYETCENVGVRCSPISSALNLAPIPLARNSVRPSKQRRESIPAYFKIKRAIDAAAGAALICALAPVILIIAIFTFLDVGAPLIFWQERVGRDGRKFLLYKFRTLRAPFDRSGLKVSTQSRLSQIGRRIRATRMDELPQLLNILKGDMSLIGPRPLLPIDQPSDPRTRLMVRPGVTGWAQVTGGTLVTAEEKNALDVWYIRHASIGLDLRIAWRTLAYFRGGERRDESAIEEALRSHHMSPEVDHQLFASGLPMPNANGPRWATTAPPANHPKGPPADFGHPR